MARRMTALQRSYFGPRPAASTTAIVVAPARRAPARRRAAAPKRRRGHRRSSGIGGGFQGLLGHAMGGALFGFAVKSGYVAKLPAIPVIGRTGTAALLLDYASRHGGGDLCGKAARAAAVLAGYQLGSEGKVTGDVDGDLQTTGDGYADGDD